MTGTKDSCVNCPVFRESMLWRVGWPLSTRSLVFSGTMQVISDNKICCRSEVLGCWAALAVTCFMRVHASMAVSTQAGTSETPIKFHVLMTISVESGCFLDFINHPYTLCMPCCWGTKECAGRLYQGFVIM